MEWVDPPESELLKKLKARQLPHPTSAGFDEKVWKDALEGLKPPANRDYQLAIAAIYFGRELQSLRAYMEGRLLTGFTRARALRLLAALANQQYVTLIGKVNERLKSLKKKPIHLEQMNQQLIENMHGQMMTADDAVSSLLDCLPHWLHHVWAIPIDAKDEEPDDAPGYGVRALTIASVERGLRDLWQGALWQGDELGMDGTAMVQKPGNADLAKQWLIWDMRNTALLAADMTTDAGAAIVTGGKLPPVQPVVDRTVIRIGRRQNGMPTFVVGRAKAYSAEQRMHVGERDTIERTNVGMFLDEPLPLLGHPAITCRNLNHAWWVFEDAARLIRATFGRSDLPDDATVGQYAIPVSATDLVQILVDALNIEPEKARRIVDLFTCDPSNVGLLYRQSLWTKPFLPHPGTDERHIFLAPLMVGSAIRRIEAWMVEGGIADDNGMKGRGLPYEAFVRRTLGEAIDRNPAFTDFAIDPDGLKRKKKGEEIDLLLRIGDTVLVGEVKCFTSPSEPLERANYLKSIAKATAQARRKVTWAADNRDLVARRLGIEDPDRIARLNFTPLVMLAQSFGIGLSREDVPVVDYHYLHLLLGYKSYHGDTRFERDVGVIYERVELYKDQDDFEGKVAELLANPPPLKRYENTVGWRRTPFATSDGSELFLELPELIAPPVQLGSTLFA